MSEPSPVFYHRGDDPQLLEASERARLAFRFFWHQVALDFNRVVPALSLACLKAPFSDDFSDPDAPVEHMWLGAISWDGVHVSAGLLNEPNQLTSVKAGDRVAIPLAQLSDWLLLLGGDLCGAFTIQVMRAHMGPQQRREHDEAWGLPFPAPEVVRVPPLNDTFQGVIAGLIEEQISKDPAIVTTTYEAGHTLLHREALYGRLPSVRLLLEHGAQRDARCDRGWTARQYAEATGWEEIAAVLA